MKIQFGFGVSDLRGKIGGAVASKNRSSNYFRRKVTPVNPRTSYQLSVRERLSATAKAWAGLTAAQRSAWGAAVSQWTSTNIFGDLKSPSGFQLYSRLNLQIKSIGGTAITDPPAVGAPFVFQTMAVTATSGTPSMSLTYSPTLAGTSKYQLFATPPVSPGKAFVNNMYRQIGTLTNSNASPFNMLSMYQGRFGTSLPAGQVIYFKLVPVITATGQKGLGISCSCVIGA